MRPVMFNPAFTLFPGTRLLSVALLLVGLAADLCIIVGAFAAFRGDARGVGITWSSAWFICGLAPAGFVLNLLLIQASPHWQNFDAYTKGNVVGQSFWPAAGAVVEFGLVIFLLRKAGTKARTA